MTAHNMVYGVSGESVSDIAGLKAKGIIDFHQVVHAGAAPDPNFVARCNAAGVSPIFNNGNDGINGNGNQDPHSYYAAVANAGYHAAGGESEQNAEDHGIMDNLVFMNYGGEGLQPLSNIFANVLPEGASGHGIASYLETYKADTQLYPNEVVQSCIIAHQKGCKEVGFMIGGWMPVVAQPYIDMARQLEAQGVTCNGFVLWWGYGSSMDSTFNKWASVFAQLQAIWPPETRTMKQRFAGAAPTPTPTPSPTPTPPKPTITFTTTPSAVSRTPGTLDVFAAGSDTALWHGYFNGSTWTWESLGGVTTSPPAAVAYRGQLNVFVRGSDGTIYSKWYSGTSWTAWQTLGGATLKGTGPTVTCSSDGSTIDVFVLGNDNALYRKHWDGSAAAWSTWQKVAGKIQ